MDAEGKNAKNALFDRLLHENHLCDLPIPLASDIFERVWRTSSSLGIERVEQHFNEIAPLAKRTWNDSLMKMRLVVEVRTGPNDLMRRSEVIEIINRCKIGG
jgi:hypothetical protein